MNNMEIKGEPKPNSSFQNLYHVQNTAGSPLTYGLRSFNIFFEKNCVELELQNKNFAATILKIAKIMLNIIVYPILGTLALIGVGINKIHLSFHNHTFKRLGTEAIEKFQSLEKASPRFSQTDNIETYDFEKKQSGMALLTSPLIQECKDNFHKKVRIANSEGLFITNFSLDAQEAHNLIDKLTLKLAVSVHRPENQDLIRLIIETVKTAVKSGQLTIDQIQKMKNNKESQ
jgi:hypothetical protein